MKTLIIILLCSISLLSNAQNNSSKAKAAVTKAKKLTMFDAQSINNDALKTYLYAEVKTNLTIHDIAYDVKENGKEVFSYIITYTMPMANIQSVKLTETIIEGGGPVEYELKIKLVKGKTAAKVLLSNDNEVKSKEKDIVLYFTNKENATKLLNQIKAKIKN